MLLDIGEGLGAVGPVESGVLRRQVLTRQFDSGLALGHLLKNLETAASLAQACGVQAPLLAACRNSWAAAESCLGSGADQSALIRWLETLAPAAAKSEA
jgi:3-hydroxyisobutyrate dehydrogenase